MFWDRGRKTSALSPSLSEEILLSLSLSLPSLSFVTSPSPALPLSLSLSLFHQKCPLTLPAQFSRAISRARNAARRGGAARRAYTRMCVCACACACVCVCVCARARVAGGRTRRLGCGRAGPCRRPRRYPSPPPPGKTATPARMRKSAI